jgi:hypothetical protein
LADGWFPLMPLGPVLDEAIGIVTESAQEVGRGPVPFEGRVTLTSDAGDSVGEEVTRWRDLGAQYISLNTMGQGHGGVDGHIAALGRAAPGALLG